MSAETTIRDSMNSADPNRLDAAFREVSLGEILTLVIAGLTPTESGVSITSDVATLADQPQTVFQVTGIGGVGEVKKLLKGPITGPSAIAPNPGEVVWDGGLSLLFNDDDAETTCDVTYTLADGSDRASILMRAIGEIDKK